MVIHVKKEFEQLHPYTNLTDLLIFEYLLNKSDLDKSTYNKLRLISKNADELYIISKAVEVYERKCCINNLVYKDLIEEYKKILKKTSKLAKELNLKNSLELSMLFMFLLFSGYFSKNQKNKYKSFNNSGFEGIYGLRLMKGKGNCLNHSFMLNDFLNENEIICTVMPSNIEEEISGKVGSDYIDLTNKIYKPNHAFNLIEENKKLYEFDFTNNYLLDVKGPNVAKHIITGKSYSINPYSIFSNKCKSHFSLMKELFTQKEFISPYSVDEYIRIRTKLHYILKNNMNLLEDYYDDTKKHILKILKGIKK